MDIRKFEIELYWKRATYFWTFIAAAFAGYALTYKTSSEHEPWLSLVFSALGLVFSFAWYLVNRGSKYWQNNWERHVDLLEDITLGPLYKIRAEDDAAKRSWLTGPGEFSVSKINQLLSLFVVLIWCCLLVKSLKLPWPPVDLALGPFEMMVLAITAVGLFMLWYKGRSSNVETAVKLKRRNLKE